MRPLLQQFRAWLLQNGLFPKGKLAFITWYLLGLDLLLLAIQQVGSIFRNSFGKSLAGWITFLTALVIIFSIVLASRWLSSRLLWRLRNRLIVTYIFIGVVPLLLLISLGGLALYLFAGQFSTYIVTSRLDSELQQLRASNAVVAAELAGGLNAGQDTRLLDAMVKTGNDTRVTAWLDGKALLNRPGTSPSLFPPQKLQPDLTAVVRDGGRLFLRSATQSQTSKGTLIVISSSPLNQRVLMHIASGLGEVTLEEPADNSATRTSQLETSVGSFRPTVTVGSVPSYRYLLDIVPVVLSTSISAVNWNGDGESKAAIDVQTRASALYDHLFVAPGEFARYLESLLLAAALVFGFIELIALWIGTRLTRTVTGAVSNLYQATTHVNRGDFSHRIPIKSNDQIAALAGSFNLMTESIEKLILEQKEKHRLENEITIAQEVQAQLFPRHISQLSSLEVHGFCRPARSVSGDYYDFLTIGSEKLVLAVGDVSGKGISAALLMATIHSAVRAYSMEGIPILRQAQVVGAGSALTDKYDPVIPGAEVSPGNLLSLLNHQLYHSTPIEKYATLFLATYDGDGRRLTFANAGHLPPMLLGANGSIRRLEDGGTVVGLFDDINYDEGTVHLRPGDIFLAYSDGVTEPENEFGEFGEPRLIELVQENRDLPLDRITEIVTAAVDDWIGSAEQPDDVTLVLARAR